MSQSFITIEEKTLSYQFLTIPDTSNLIDLAQESWCFESFNQYSISSQPLELDQYQSFKNRIDNLVSYHFNKIELEHECEPELPVNDSVPNFESMLTPVLLPDSNHISESVLIPMPVNLELESPILHHILLTKNECEPDL